MAAPGERRKLRTLPFVPAPGLAFPVHAAALTAATSPDLKLDGWTFGGHFGYNWQFSSNWLVGLEADISYFRLRGASSGTFPFPSTLPGGVLGPPTLTFTTATSLSTDWLFTFRPRLGVIFGDSLLAYATGGLAVTNEKVAQTATGSHGGPSTPRSMRPASGWSSAAGLEYALSRNWSIRAEYLHLDFGTASGSGNIVLPAGVLGNVLCTTGQAIVTLALRPSPGVRFPRASPRRSFVPASPTGSVAPTPWSPDT